MIPAPGQAGVREAFLANRAEIASRYKEQFAGNWQGCAIGAASAAALIGLYVFSLVQFEFSPATMMRGAGRLFDIVGMMFPPTAGTFDRFLFYLNALGQTLSIAFLGTLLPAIFALPMAFIAAKNVVANSILHILSRRVLDTVRSVDTLIWALIWINVVGLGPFAGALAIACADFGSFGKLMSEAIETVDRKAVEGVLSTGGTRLQAIRFGIIPQVLPVFASQVLYFFESNTRSATIIGIVGAGGIGLHLSEQISVLEWQQVSFLILMVLVTVAVIDQISHRLRAAIMGRRSEA